MPHNYNIPFSLTAQKMALLLNWYNEDFPGTSCGDNTMVSGELLFA